MFGSRRRAREREWAKDALKREQERLAFLKQKAEWNRQFTLDEQQNPTVGVRDLAELQAALSRLRQTSVEWSHAFCSDDLGDYTRYEGVDDALISDCYANGKTANGFLVDIRLSTLERKVKVRIEDAQTRVAAFSFEALGWTGRGTPPRYEPNRRTFLAALELIKQVCKEAQRQINDLKDAEKRAQADAARSAKNRFFAD
jgi:hypothetical protein